METDKTPHIQVIDRLTALLDALGAQGGPASLKVLVAETGLHPSTAFRILGALIANGLVSRDEGGQYRLGPRLLQLAARVRSGIDLRGIARPVMERLRDQTGESVNLTVREGDEVVYIERMISPRMMRVEQVIGSRAPLHVTAVGKLMLGEGGAAACRDYATRTGLPRFTRNTLGTARQLLLDIDAALLQGYALDNEEAELGVGCIGALVRDAGGAAVAGLSVSAPIERRRMEWVPLVQEAARHISVALGYVDPAARPSGR